MYCKNYGATLPENETKCPECGTDNLENVNISAAGEERVRGFSAKKNILIIIIAAVLLVGGGITAVAVTNYNTPTAKLSRTLSLAERYLSEQNYEQAVIAFQQVLEIEPMNVDAYLGLADAYLGLEQTNNALEILKEGYEKTSDERVLAKWDNILLEQARDSFERGDSDGALKIIDDILSYDSRCVDAYLLYADILESAEDLDRAVDILERGLKETQNEDISQCLNEVKVKRALKYADKYFNEKKYEKALGEYNNALSIDEKCVRGYMGEADCNIALKKETSAVDNLQTGFDKTGDADIKMRLGKLRVELAVKNGTKSLSEKKFEAAAGEFKNALQIDDKCIDAYIGTADAYVGLKEFDKAIDNLQTGYDKTCDKSVKAKLDNLKISEYLKKGNKLLSEKKYPEAKTEFENALKLDEKCVNAYIGIANAYIGLDQNDEAVKALQDGYNETNNSNIKNKLIERLLVSANALSAEKSIAEFQKILELDETQKGAYTGLANAYIELAQKEKAIEILQTGYDKTGDADIKNMLDELTYDIEVFDAVMYTTMEISARTEPNISSEKVGDLEKGDAVSVTGKANNGWYRIFYNDKICFVNGEYLSLSKPVEPSPIETPPAGTAEALLNSVTLNPQKTGNELLDSLVESILSKITNDNMSTYEKVKACYDYAIENFSYGQTGENLGWGIKGWAYEVLVNNSGVCNNYSSAFAVMTRAIGLETYLQNGQTSSSKGGFTGHTWCTMVINGVPYLFDPQVEDNIAKGGPIYYYKFCKTYDSGTGKDNYIPQDSRYYLENEKDVNGDFLIDPGMYDSGWWMFF